MFDKSRNLWKGVDEDPYRYKDRGCTRLKLNGLWKFNQH